MCTYSFSVVKYQAGLEDGFDTVTKGAKIYIKPYIYNENGIKEYILPTDKILIKNNIKELISEINQTRRNRST